MPLGQPPLQRGVLGSDVGVGAEVVAEGEV
jgi:hypothetical protein